MPVIIAKTARPNICVLSIGYYCLIQLQYIIFLIKLKFTLFNHYKNKTINNVQSIQYK